MGTAAKGENQNTASAEGIITVKVLILLSEIANFIPATNNARKNIPDNKQAENANKYNWLSFTQAFH